MFHLPNTMIAIIIKYCLLTLIACNQTPLVTGPSYLESQITPISRNEIGQVFCRTRMTKNPIGGFDAVEIKYGYCVITDDAIIEFESFVLDPSLFPDIDSFHEQVKLLDSIFLSCVQWDNLTPVEKKISDDYGFTTCNTDKFKRDIPIRINEFMFNFDLAVTEATQKALGGAQSTRPVFDGRMYFIRYDFRNLLILKNKISLEETIIGADFDYPNFIKDKNGKNIDIGFDMMLVDGVLHFHR